MTPEHARDILANMGALLPSEVVDIIEAWERDRAELLERRRECARCGQTGLHPDGVHSCYDLSALSADYYQQWQEAAAALAAIRHVDPATLALAELGATVARHGFVTPAGIAALDNALQTPGVRERIAELLGEEGATNG
jgi:hypothetical protein